MMQKLSDMPHDQHGDALQDDEEDVRTVESGSVGGEVFSTNVLNSPVNGDVSSTNDSYPPTINLDGSLCDSLQTSCNINISEGSLGQNGCKMEMGVDSTKVVSNINGGGLNFLCDKEELALFNAREDNYDLRDSLNKTDLRASLDKKVSTKFENKRKISNAEDLQNLVDSDIVKDAFNGVD